jgi:predicted RNA-binding Zn ribbon-like protein
MDIATNTLTDSQEPLALAFANTLRSDRPGRDVLGTPALAARWLTEQPSLGGGSVPFRQLRALRDAVRTLLDAEVEGAQMDPAAVGIVNAAASRGLFYRTLEVTSVGPRIREDVAAASGDMALATIAASAVELLGGDHEPLASCQGKGCRLYFSGGRRNRRWCSSKVCGNRARVAAFAARHRPSVKPASSVTA